MANELTTLPRE